MRTTVFPLLLIFVQFFVFGCDDPGAGAPGGGFVRPDGGGQGGAGGQGGGGGNAMDMMAQPDLAADAGRVDQRVSMCGDGVVEGSEACDDGNLDPNDGCSPTCQVEMLCGNGQIDADEECDEAAADCINCSVIAVDVSRGGEYDGAFGRGSFDRYLFRLDRDGFVALSAQEPSTPCTSDLSIEVYRIDRPGRRDLIASDTGSANVACPSLRHYFLVGTYEVVVSEASGMGQSDYSFTARYEGECGDDVLNVDETCDDGNLDDGDGCDGMCQIESRCGDGLIEGVEECDDGNLSNNDGCDRDCTLERFEIERSGLARRSSIADGSRDIFRFVIDGQSRVQGVASSGDGMCRPGLDTVLTLYRIGPSGERIQLETNDDAPGLRFCSRLEAEVRAGTYEFEVGDLFGGDAIDDYVFEFSSYRLVEPGGQYRGAFAARGDDQYRFTTAREQRVVLKTDENDGRCVGDLRMRLSRLEADEEWVPVAPIDDGRELGCDRFDGRLEVGTYRVLIDSTEAAAIEDYPFSILLEGVCGDGDINIGESCDDSNQLNGDGCASDCRIEDPCGNGRLDEGESCDDGNVIAGDGCDTTCQVDRFDLIRGQDSVELDVPGGLVRYFDFVVDGDSDLRVDRVSDVEPCLADASFRYTLNRVTENGPELIETVEEAMDCRIFDREVSAGQYEIVAASQAARPTALDLSFALVQRMAAAGEYAGAYRSSGTDHYAFTLDAAQSVRFESVSGRCPDGIEFSLTANGDVVVDRAAAADGCTVLEARLDAGEYTLVVSGQDEGALDTYTLHFELGAEADVCGDGETSANEACDDNNLVNGDGCSSRCEVEQAEVVSARTTVTGNLAQAGHAAHTVTLDGDSAVTINFEDGAGDCRLQPGTNMILVDALGEALNELQYDGNVCPTLEIALGAGSYDIRLDAPASAIISAYSFELLVVRELAIGAVLAGSMSPLGSDLYAVDVVAGGAHRISTSPDNRCAGDTRLEIYNDDFSAVIAQAEGGGVGLCAATTSLLQAGSYWLLVYAGDEAIEDYDVSVTPSMP